MTPPVNLPSAVDAVCLHADHLTAEQYARLRRALELDRAPRRPPPPQDPSAMSEVNLSSVLADHLRAVTDHRDLLLASDASDADKTKALSAFTSAIGTLTRNYKETLALEDRHALREAVWEAVRSLPKESQEAFADKIGELTRG